MSKFMLYGSMRLDLLFSTVKTTDLYLIPRENYSKNTHPSSILERTIVKRQQKDKSIIVHYTYERRFGHYEFDVHKLWNASFPTASEVDSKVIVGTRENSNLTKELVRRSSSLTKISNKQKQTAH